MRTRHIDKFFKYARARHQIYMDRMDGKPRPWTKDKILDTYRFTNVFRELDRTTAWFRGYVREPMRNDPNVMLATVVFRMLNRIQTGEAIFCQHNLGFKLGGETNAFEQYLHLGDWHILRNAIKTYCGKKGPYVTGAYIISSPKGYNKLDGVLKVIDNFQKTSGWYGQAQESMREKTCTLEDAWNWFKDFKFIGPFHAYEIVTDLRHTALLENAPDIMTWANPGPGAHRGANRVFRGDKSDKVSREQVIFEMRILLSWSRSPNHWPQDWPKWEMRDVEHTLCEFDKYERVRNGEGRPRGVYR